MTDGGWYLDFSLLDIRVRVQYTKYQPEAPRHSHFNGYVQYYDHIGHGTKIKHEVMALYVKSLVLNIIL